MDIRLAGPRIRDYPDNYAIKQLVGIYANVPAHDPPALTSPSLRFCFLVGYRLVFFSQ